MVTAFNCIFSGLTVAVITIQSIKKKIVTIVNYRSDFEPINDGVGHLLADVCGK